MSWENSLQSVGEARASTPSPYEPPSIKRRLEAAEKATLERAKAIQDAKEILAKNPDIERLLDILQKNAF